MFITLTQPRDFILCVSIGIISGIIYDIIYLLTNHINKKIVTIIGQLIYFILASVLFTKLSQIFSIGNFRLYMAIGVMVGLLIYIKSFHKTIAKIDKKVYNKINIIKTRIINLFRKVYERRKKAKGVIGGGIRRGNVTMYVSGNKRIPNSRHNNT